MSFAIVTSGEYDYGFVELTLPIAIYPEDYTFLRETTMCNHIHNRNSATDNNRLRLVFGVGKVSLI